MSVLFAVDVDAHLVKCAVNKEILIPDLRRNSFTHLAVVCEFLAYVDTHTIVKVDVALPSVLLKDQDKTYILQGIDKTKILIKFKWFTD